VTGYWCEYAELGAGPVSGVRVVEEAGWIVAVDRAATPGPGDTRLAGLVLPGFANAHSHAFHRALRGATEAGTADFWRWRDRLFT